jgi:hypothetical protein
MTTLGFGNRMTSRHESSLEILAIGESALHARLAGQVEERFIESDNHCTAQAFTKALNLTAKRLALHTRLRRTFVFS